MQVSVEAALRVVFQPQAIFRVRPVARCTASMPGTPVLCDEFAGISLPVNAQSSAPMILLVQFTKPSGIPFPVLTYGRHFWHSKTICRRCLVAFMHLLLMVMPVCLRTSGDTKRLHLCINYKALRVLDWACRRAHRGCSGNGLQPRRPPAGERQRGHHPEVLGPGHSDAPQNM